VGELLTQEEDVVGLKAPDDRLGERVALGPQFPAREFSQRSCIRLTLREPLQDLTG
jgi:hypothetical protein